MNLINLWRLTLTLLILALASGICSFLADKFNTPTMPEESAFAFMLIVLTIAGTITLFTKLFNFWKRKESLRGTAKNVVNGTGK